MSRTKTVFADFTYIWLSFYEKLCLGLMLHESSGIRKSSEIFFPRPHKSFKKNSKAISSPSSLWSISSLCLDIVRKHLKGILRTYEKSFEFPEKNNNFVKKLRLFYFRFIFLLNSFLVSPKDPRITKNYWLSRKGQPWSALIFLQTGLLFSGFLVIFSKR